MGAFALHFRPASSNKTTAKLDTQESVRCSGPNKLQLTVWPSQTELANNLGNSLNKSKLLHLDGHEKPRSVSHFRALSQVDGFIDGSHTHFVSEDEADDDDDDDGDPPI